MHQYGEERMVDSCNTRKSHKAISKGITWTDVAVISFFSIGPVGSMLGLFVSNSTAITIILGTICYLPVFLLMTQKMSKIPYDFILVLGFTVITFGVTYIFHPEYKEVLTSRIGFYKGVLTFASSIFGYFFIRLQDDPQKLSRNLKTIALIHFIYFIWQPMQVIRTGYWISVDALGIIHYSYYDMTFGYSLIFPSIILIYFGLKEKKALYILMSLCGLFAVFIFGSRGPLVCYALFMLIYFIYITEKKQKKNIIAITALLVILLAFVLSGESINRLLINTEITSRNFSLIMSKSIMQEGGRAVIWNSCLKLIYDSIFVGKGAMSDQYYLSSYSHNLFLELMVTFGAIIGLLLSIAIIFITVRMLRKCNDPDWKAIFAIFFAIAFGKLMFSSSFWYETYLWAALGIIVSYSKSLKKKRKFRLNKIEQNNY